jgi:DNA-binding response OmpR family regulator
MTSGSSPRHVLLIDDDPSLTEPLRETLELLAGYGVTVATDGQSGLRALFAQRPDCVVVDIRMPGIDGYQFIHAVRGDPDTAQIPLVVLSALAQEEHTLAGYLSGADAYLHKPVDLDDLLAAVDQAIALTAAQREARLRALAADDEGN